MSPQGLLSSTVRKDSKEGSKMEKGGQDDISAPQVALGAAHDGPGSETERFQAITDLRHNEAVTGESGVPHSQRDHELRRQLNSLDEFS
jgi:hypothetical protein